MIEIEGEMVLLNVFQLQFSQVKCAHEQGQTKLKLNYVLHTDLRNTLLYMLCLKSFYSVGLQICLNLN